MTKSIRLSDEKIEQLILSVLSQINNLGIPPSKLLKIVLDTYCYPQSFDYYIKNHLHDYGEYMFKSASSITAERVSTILSRMKKQDKLVEAGKGLYISPRFDSKTKRKVSKEASVIYNTLSVLRNRHVLSVASEELLKQDRAKIPEARASEEELKRWRDAIRGDKVTLEKFPEFFARHGYTDSYAHATSYLKQALRKLHYTGYSYFDGSTLIFITTKEKGKLPFVLVAPIGKRRANKTVNLANLLAEISRREVIIKKMSSRDINIASRRHGIKSYKKGEGWHPDYRHDDDTFDAPIIDVNELTTAKGKRYLELRRKRNHLYRNHSVEFVPYDPKKHFSEAKKLLKRWAIDFVKRNPGENKKIIINAHLPFLESLPPGKKNENFIALLMRIDGKPAGFSLAERIGRKSFGLYANFALTKYFGTSQELVAQTCQAIKEAGGKFLNMGGSEFRKTHEFKKQFRPVKHEKTKHLVVRPQALKTKRK